ncbi:MAG: ATPase [Alphaproteobacteria bacterium]|nr:ATPase [Alphaproteobacteria bacterium]
MTFHPSFDNVFLHKGCLVFNGKNMDCFVGRKKELAQIKALDNTPFPKLVVIKGRRRIGKSQLVEEASKGKIFLNFTGLPPIEDLSDQDQRDSFAQQVSQYFHIPPFSFNDWSDGFAHVTKYLTQKPTVLLLDEISWMGSKDPTFVPKLKVWWDVTLKKYPNLILVFCGSVSTWIEKNIIRSTAFFGRISLQIDLEDLSLKESFELLKKLGVKASTYDIFKILSITGGVPWYLVQINPQETIDSNIKRLCFKKNGLLVHEFDRIFNDLFGRSADIYRKIVGSLASGMKTRQEIMGDLNYPDGGYMTNHLEALEISGFITKHYHWSLKTKKMGRNSLYRLSDNYLRFYLSYINPNLPKITQNSFEDLAKLPGWEAMMGYQVENLLLKNRNLILKELGIPPEDIVADNPYHQTPRIDQRGCQIDYLIQTQANNLYVCEFKFRRKELTTEIIDQMKDKINRFYKPKGYGIAPVLLHLGDVSNALYESRYFYRIIDIEKFLE